MGNAITAQRPKFSALISTQGYQKLINSTIKDPARARRFVTAITSAVAVNPALQECDPATILSGALLGESLNLSPSPQLGHYYLVPFNNRNKGCKDAQFQMGYKGYIQLAERSGYYKNLNAAAIKAGELTKWDPISEEYELSPIMDEAERENMPTVGYIAYFRYLNGFTKTIYWSREKMEAHALRYSKGYSAKKGYTFWEKEFDAMACKTMLRQLISKWGVMSIDFQLADNFDGAVVSSEGGEFVLSPSEETPDALPETEGAPEPAEGSPDRPSGQEQVSLDDV